MGLHVKNLTLKYGKKTILKDVSFSVASGEIVTLFGPSGVGKTSLLKLIAGIQPLKSGTLEFTEGFSQTETIIVFQDYWLFPHMTVFENIAFGLKARKEASQMMKNRVSEMIRQFDLAGLENHFPEELSGGQKQRVALARALILRPKLLLLDEPFSSLDSNLRVRMREYLVKLQQKYQFSVILVTHDKEEAFSLSDRLVVILEGGIQQIASPKELYYRPKTKAVASLIGEMNYLKGVIQETTFTLGNSTLTVENPENLAGSVELLLPYGASVSLEKTGIPASIKQVIWQPNGNQVVAIIADQDCLFTNLPEVKVGQQVFLKFLDSLQVLPR